ncbi:2'-5' RNA ligase family protein [Streptomyces griseoaurantiacus]|uniref:2'-5' RNA ligase family protein n=1 Tax=Streptomyces griseoaurantiacus TaxID=68213 RepID=UPI0036A0FB32
MTTYPLSHPLEGWHAAITSGGHQVVHRTDPDTKTLHVGYAGHNIADAEERLGSSGGGEGHALPVEFHKSAEKDFDKLHPEVQDKVLDTIDRLSRREPHPHDHALTGPLKGWGAARADFLNRVTHRYEDNEGNPTGAGNASRLFIGHVGPHNYDDAIKRLTSQPTRRRGSSLTDFFRKALRQAAKKPQEPVQHQAAAVDNSGGVMVAIVPPREIAEQLVLAEGQPADDLHITLAYLGQASDYTREQLMLLPQVVSAWAVRQKPTTVRIGGIGKFNNEDKGQHVLWAAPDIPGGAQMHASLAHFLEGHGYRLPSEHGWTPHMTLAYVDRHFRFMPHLEEHHWDVTEVVTFVRGQQHPARLGLKPVSPTTL